MKKISNILTTLLLATATINISASETKESNNNSEQILSFDERLELSEKIRKIILKANPINNKNATTSATDDGILIKSNISLTLVKNGRMPMFEIFDLIKKAVKRPVCIYRKHIYKNVKMKVDWSNKKEICEAPYEYRYYLYWGDKEKHIKRSFEPELKEHYDNDLFNNVGYWDINYSVAHMYTKIVVEQAEKQGIKLGRNDFVQPSGLKCTFLTSYDPIHTSEKGKQIFRDALQKIAYIMNIEKAYLYWMPNKTTTVEQNNKSISNVYYLLSYIKNDSERGDVWKKLEL